MQFHFHANQSYFHKKGFGLRLALKQRYKGTQKWPIVNGQSEILFWNSTVSKFDYDVVILPVDTAHLTV